MHRPRIPIWLPLVGLLFTFGGFAAELYIDVARDLIRDAIARKVPDSLLMKKVFTSPVPSDVSDPYIRDRIIRDALRGAHRNTLVSVYDSHDNDRRLIANNSAEIKDRVPEAAADYAIKLLQGWERDGEEFRLVEGARFTIYGTEYHMIGRHFQLRRSDSNEAGELIFITNLDTRIAPTRTILIRGVTKITGAVGFWGVVAIVINVTPLLQITRQIRRGQPICVAWWAPIQFELLAEQLRLDRAANEQFRSGTEQYKKEVAIGQKMLEIAPVMMVRCKLPKQGKQAIFTYVNPAVQEQLGWAGLAGQPLNTIVPPEYGGYHTWMGLHDDDLGREVGMSKCPMHGHKSRVVDAVRPIKAVTAIGEQIDVLLSVAMLPPDEDGSLNFAGTMVDVTPLTVARRTAEEYAAIAKSVIDGITDAIIFLKQEDGTYRLCNEAFIKLAGRDPIGLKDSDLTWTASETAKYHGEDKAVISTGEPISILEQIGGQPDSHWFLTRKVRVSIEGKPSVLGISLDVDELVKARRAAETLAEEIQTVNHIAVHDIKADLTALNLGAELIQETIAELTVYLADKSDDVIDEAIDTINHFSGLNIKSARNAFDVLDQRNKLYNLESKIEIARCPVTDLLDSLSAAFSSEPGELRIHNECPENRQILADKSLLLTVLKNIVRNGFVHNDSALKRVEIRVTPIGHRSRIQITDNGVGMPSAYLENWGKVLGKAAQLSTKRGGSGTGLYSIRAIVLAHKGASIDVTSAVGQGTTFTLEFDHVA